MPSAQECLETRPKESKHMCAFFWRLTRLEPVATEELWFACEGTGVSTGGRAHSSSIFFAVWTKESETCTESGIISLDAGLHMDDLLAFHLWDMVIEVLRSTNNLARQCRLAQGALCGTGDYSIKSKTKTPTETRLREAEQSPNLDYVPNTFFSRRVSVEHF